MKIYETKDFQLVALLNKHVQDVHVELYPESFKEFDYDRVSAFFERIMNQTGHFFFVAETEDGPVGYVWAELKHFPENAFKRAYKCLLVHQLSVSESVRHSGIGTRLMEHIEEFGQSYNVDVVELDYWADNERARNFYNKQGYKVHREFVQKRI